MVLKDVYTVQSLLGVTVGKKVTMSNGAGAVQIQYSLADVPLNTEFLRIMVNWIYIHNFLQE